MYSLVRMLPTRRLLAEQLHSIGGAWVIAEIFYKFHSFTLELAAFLATWFVLDAMTQTASRHLFAAVADEAED